MLQKYRAMTLFKFLDTYPLPTNLKEVEEQNSGRTFHFLLSLDPETLQSEVMDSLDCTKFIDEWACDRNFNNRYFLALWIVSSN